MITTSARQQARSWALLACVALGSSSLFAGGKQPAAPSPWPWQGDAAGLHQLNLCQLDDLYRRASISGSPTGFLHGEVIQFTNMPAPRLAKRLSDTFWVGKHIREDGYFINQWRRRQALSSHVTLGPSYVDGGPSLVFEYPRFTPLFGPMRDEYREVAPGLYLGRMYRRRPFVRFLGFNYLQLGPSGCCASGVLLTTEGPPSMPSGLPGIPTASPRPLRLPTAP
jgi:hypothetical protein